VVIFPLFSLVAMQTWKREGKKTVVGSNLQLKTHGYRQKKKIPLLDQIVDDDGLNQLFS